MNQGTCSIAQCEKPKKARGWCAMHYARYTRFGDPEATPPRFAEKICTVEGCGGKAKGRSLCGMHYARLLTHGDALYGGAGRSRGEWGRTHEEAFSAAPKAVNAKTGCIEWGGITRHGYGIIQSKVYGSRMAHRVSYSMHNGDLPDDLHVCHTCDNPPCVNPEHLFLGDDKVNVDDMMSKMRHSYGVRHPGAKLDDARVVAILEAFDGGAPRPALAKAYGVSPATVQKITERKSWRHVKFVPTGRLLAHPAWASALDGVAERLQLTT